MLRDKKQNNAYKDSLLAKSVALVLVKIDECIKMTDKSAEGRYAKATLSQIKRVIELLDEDILPLFDNGAVPHIKPNPFKGVLKAILSPGVVKELAVLKLNEDNYLPKIKHIGKNLQESLPKIIKESFKTIKENNSDPVTVFEDINKAIIKELESNSRFIKLHGATFDGDPNGDIIKALSIEINKISSFKSVLVDNSINEENLKKYYAFKIGMITSDYFYKNEIPTYNVMICEEATYNLAIELLKVYKALPPKLYDFIPFFNTDFIYGKLARLITKQSRIQTKIKPIDKEKDPLYFVIAQEDKPEVIIDSNKYYQSVREKSDEALEEKFKEYFEAYSKTTHVQSEVAKATALNSYIQKTTDHYNAILADLNKYKPLNIKESVAETQINETTVEDSINNLLLHFEQNKKYLKICESAISELNKEDDFSKKTPTIREIIGNAASDKIAKEGLIKNFKTKFLNEALSDVNVIKSEDGSIQIISVKERKKEIIKNSYKAINDVKAAIENENKNLTQNALKKFNVYLENKNKELIKNIVGCNEKLTYLNLEDSKSYQDISSLKKQTSILADITNELTVIHDNTIKFIKNFETIFGKAENHSIKSIFDNLAKITAIKQTTSERLAQLNIQLKNLEYKEKFGDLLKSKNIEKFQVVIDEKEKSVKDIEESLSQKNKDLIVAESELTTLKQNNNNVESSELEKINPLLKVLGLKERKKISTKKFATIFDLIKKGESKKLKLKMNLVALEAVNSCLVTASKDHVIPYVAIDGLKELSGGDINGFKKLLQLLNQPSGSDQESAYLKYSNNLKSNKVKRILKKIKSSKSRKEKLYQSLCSLVLSEISAIKDKESKSIQALESIRNELISSQATKIQEINKSKNLISTKITELKSNKDTIEFQINAFKEIHKFFKEIIAKINYRLEASYEQKKLLERIKTFKEEKIFFEKKLSELKSKFGRNSDSEVQYQLQECEKALKSFIDDNVTRITGDVNLIVSDGINQHEHLLSILLDKNKFNIDNTKDTFSILENKFIELYDLIKSNEDIFNQSEFIDKVKIQDLMSYKVSMEIINKLMKDYATLNLVVLDNNLNVPDKLANLKKLHEHFKQPAKKDPIVIALSEAIEFMYVNAEKLTSNSLSKNKRSEFVDFYTKKLDAYIKDHELYDQDATLLESFSETKSVIHELKDKLHAFIESNETISISDLISKRREKIIGLNLAPLLDEILANIDSSSSGLVEEKRPEPIFNPMDPVSLLFNKIDTLNKYGYHLFASKKIEDKTKGKVAIDLADELKNEAKRFFSAKSNYAENEFEQFNKKFSRILHSQDKVMGKHRALWKVIIANIAISLTVFGAIALGGYAIHSKVSHGHFSAFFNKTKRQEHLGKIEKSIHNINKKRTK